MVEANTSSPPGSTPAAPANRNRWASIKSRGQVICSMAKCQGLALWELMVNIAALMWMSVARSLGLKPGLF